MLFVNLVFARDDDDDDILAITPLLAIACVENTEDDVDDNDWFKLVEKMPLDTDDSSVKNGDDEAVPLCAEHMRKGEKKKMKFDQQIIRTEQQIIQFEEFIKIQNNLL